MTLEYTVYLATKESKALSSSVRKNTRQGKRGSCHWAGSAPSHMSRQNKRVYIVQDLDSGCYLPSAFLQKKLFFSVLHEHDWCVQESSGPVVQSLEGPSVQAVNTVEGKNEHTSLASPLCALHTRSHLKTHLCNISRSLLL